MREKNNPQVVRGVLLRHNRSFDRTKAGGAWKLLGQWFRELSRGRNGIFRVPAYIVNLRCPMWSLFQVRIVALRDRNAKIKDPGWFPQSSIIKQPLPVVEPPGEDWEELSPNNSLEPAAELSTELPGEPAGVNRDELGKSGGPLFTRGTAL